MKKIKICELLVILAICISGLMLTTGCGGCYQSMCASCGASMSTSVCSTCESSYMGCASCLDCLGVGSFCDGCVNACVSY